MININDFPVLPRVRPPLCTDTDFRIGFILDYQLYIVSDLAVQLDKLNNRNVGQLHMRLKIKRRIKELNKTIAQLFRYRSIIK